MNKKIFFIAIAVILSADVSAQNKTEEVTFWVAGVCGMCEKTIENALDVKGIIAADYNLESHQIKVVYRPAKITVEKMHQLINAVGYDTEKSSATEEQYSKVHGCCKYRSLDNH
jgi:periplasmic mercuric ion binding protein